MVCHVLRYTPFYSRVKQLIDEGVLGDIVTIVHTEGLGNIHQSHSFVRGNWGNTAKSNIMLLARFSRSARSNTSAAKTRRQTRRNAA